MRARPEGAGRHGGARACVRACVRVFSLLPECSNVMAVQNAALRSAIFFLFIVRTARLDDPGQANQTKNKRAATSLSFMRLSQRLSFAARKLVRESSLV